MRCPNKSFKTDPNQLKTDWEMLIEYEGSEDAAWAAFVGNDFLIPDISTFTEQEKVVSDVKKRVEELFDSNPELANAVYSALGFKTKTSENEITRGIKEILPFKVIGDYSNIEEGLTGRRQYSTAIDGNNYVFDISTYSYENEDGTFQSYYDIDFTVNGSEDIIGTGFFDKSEKAKQIIQAIISQNYGNDTIRLNVEESKKGKQRLLLYKRLMNQLGYNPSEEMEYTLFYNTNTFLSPSDKIIFGHPTIGKSFLKNQGEDKFITLDDDYANEVNSFIDANKGSETRQEYKGRKPKEYNDFMLNLYDKLKIQAKKEGKILFVSNTNILKERMSDFDKVITMPKDEFKKRFDARGATYGFEDWKSDIDATVAKVPTNKIINTTGYLSDLFKPSNEIGKINLTPQQKQQAQQLYSQYVQQTGKQDIEGFKEFVDKKDNVKEEIVEEKNIEKIQNNEILSLSDAAKILGTRYPNQITSQQLRNMHHIISKLNNTNYQNGINEVYRTKNVKRVGQSVLFTWEVERLKGQLNVENKINRAIANNEGELKEKTKEELTFRQAPPSQLDLFLQANQDKIDDGSIIINCNL